MERKTAMSKELACLETAIEHANESIDEVHKAFLKLSDFGLTFRVQERLMCLANMCNAMNNPSFNPNKDMSKQVSELAIMVNRVNLIIDTNLTECTPSIREYRSEINRRLSAFLNHSNETINSLVDGDEIAEEDKTKALDRASGVTQLFDYKIYADRNQELIFNSDSPYFIKEECHYKPHLVVTKCTMEELEKVKAKFPNFDAPTDYLIARVNIALKTGLPLQMDPVLLNSTPGLGKTAYINAITTALGTDSFFIQMGTITGAFELSGGNSQWKDATPGKLAKIMMFESKNATPVIVLEELCRMKNGESHSPLHSLYALLERSQRSKYLDNFFNMEFDISSAIVFATANDPELIPDAIRSRLKIFEINPPATSHMKGIVKNIYAELLEDDGLDTHFIKTLSKDVLDKLSTFTPREATQIINNAIAAASFRINDKRKVSLKLSDLVLPESAHRAQKRSIGF